MKIGYHFDIEGTTLNYDVEVDREFDFLKSREDLPAWVELKHHQCENCPLTVKDCQYCPAAVDLAQVVTDFQRLPADKTSLVEVITPERTYTKQTSVEEGLRSLMGLVMATSACPILQRLKPNARYHLPFASQDEFIMRSSALYLLRQYFEYRQGKRPDWDMQGLIRLNQDLQTLNEGLWQRLGDACEGNSNVQALLSFLNMSSSVSYSLEAQLDSIKALLTDDELSPAMVENRQTLF